MVREFFHKLNEFASHHQVLVLMTTGFSIVCASWGVEKILENFICTSNSLFGYLGVVAGSLSLIWFVRRYVTREE